VTAEIDLPWLPTLWIIIALFSAVASAVAAQSKRMSTLGGLLMGAVFGPLALLAIAAMAPSGAPCRMCREPIHEQAKICPCCRSESPHG
jgi:4-hydroxybenzoate polyprenyltransferase